MHTSMGAIFCTIVGKILRLIKQQHHSFSPAVFTPFEDYSLQDFNRLICVYSTKGKLTRIQ